MKRFFSHMTAAGLGAAVIVALNSARPVTPEQVLLKGILGFARTLEGYGIKPEFNPQACSVIDAPPQERRDLGSHLVLLCRLSTPEGSFYSCTGYDRAGRIVNGGQGFEEKEG
jgi:hypothetical protein